MRRFFSLFLMLCVAWGVYAQSVSQIKNDPEYLWAEGEGETMRFARNQALEGLISQIAVHVAGERRSDVINNQTGQEVTSVVRFEQVMKTHSAATLTNTGQLILSDEPEAKIFLFIKKSELDKIFAKRIDKIKEFIEVADGALQRNQVDDAIRYYYWANILFNSLRPDDDVKIVAGDKEVSASFLIKERLDDIFDNIEVKLLGKQENTNNYEVFFTYKERPVANLDFTYDVGNGNWSPVNEARDGRALLEFAPGQSPEYLRIKYECEHYDDSQCDREVNEVLGAVKPIYYANARVQIPVVDKVLSSEVKVSAKDSQAPASDTDAMSLTSAGSLLSDEKVTTFTQTVSKVVDAICRKNYAAVQQYFTTQGYDVFNRLIKYGKAQVVGNDFKLSFSELNDYVSCRSVPMKFTFSGQRSFVENVVFVFDNSGKIDNISFGLSQVAQEDIFSAEAWKPEAKEVLVSFLETYKTAYALERADFLESIFADDALIITGHVVKKFTGSAEYGYNTNRYVQLTRHTKSEYISRLRNTFRNNEFINIKFANNDVKKAGKDNQAMYAVQIKQDYFSTNYGDSGYLFLLVDVTDPGQPIIHVRAWQENPDPSWGILGPEHF